jgi:hypothetical protein
MPLPFSIIDESVAEMIQLSLSNLVFRAKIFRRRGRLYRLAKLLGLS